MVTIGQAVVYELVVLSWERSCVLSWELFTNMLV